MLESRWSGLGVHRVRRRDVGMHVTSTLNRAWVQGTTKVALYGLGNVRDERLGRMFQTPGCVEW